MKKLLSLVLTLAIVLSSAAALADLGSATVVDANEKRNIQIHPAGENTVEPGISPTTGRDLDELAEQAEDGFLGMAITGEYYPIMVQHNGYHSALDAAAPWYGSYADIVYELPKAWVGNTRMAFIYNDFLPPLAGGSRSTRVGYISVRQEWNCPYFFAGKQQDSFGGKTDTNVDNLIEKLGLITDVNTSAAPETVTIFNGLDSKKFKEGAYRWTGGNSEYNFLWSLPYMYTNILQGETPRQFKNHTFKFADDLPETGDTAETVYVLYNKNSTKGGDANDEDPTDDSRIYYYNSMYQYDEDENAYIRYAITDMKNPENNPKAFVEKIIAPGTEAKVIPPQKSNDTQTIEIQSAPGDVISFANIIVQAIDDKWPGGEMPYPILIGSGNADYFMGGKHLKGVWKRDTIEDRTVFYGEDGEEIALQPGRTIIIMMDYGTTVKNRSTEKQEQVREVRYE